MATIILEGENLGKRHKYYNGLLKQALDKNEVPLAPIDYNATDIDNFLRIDIANSKKNVDYILEVFKSNDLLYVTRAIKKATWLITDEQYANIINPEYLYSELFPAMTSKSSHKLALQIRLQLRNEKRVENFYNYLQDKDFKSAAKWLPGCSVQFLKEVLPKKVADIQTDILHVLSKKSFDVFEIIVKVLDYRTHELMERNMHYLVTHSNAFLDLIEGLDCRFPRFGPKSTKLILTKCPERIFNKLEKYIYNIDIETLAKNMKNEDVKDFITKLFEDKKYERLTTLDKLKPFINKIPKEERFEYVTKIFANRPESSDMIPPVAYKCAMQCDYVCGSGGGTHANIYRNYIYAPFSKAFTDLSKLIRSESSPSERNAMLLVMLTCAKNNEVHIRTLLEYYVQKLMNTPPNFKIHFINNVISKSKVHTFDAATWKVLNEIFYSLGVYNLNDKETSSVQTIIQTIVTYNVLKKQPVPEVIEQKLCFDSLKNIQNKLNADEKERVFEYLYNLLKTKIEKQNITSETHFHKACDEVESMLSLIRDFDKDVQNYSFAHDKVRELLKINLKNSWNMSMTNLYNFKKSWRKYLFEESLLLNPTEKVCFNVLKHNPELLTRYEDVVKKLSSNDSVKLTKVLRKIRIYWSESLATSWSSQYLGRLQEQKAGTYKSLVKGLCVLLPQTQLIDVIKTHAPKEDKISWSDEVEEQLAIRKQLAKNMFLARPLLPPGCVLLYAKGDYLQFALPSFDSIFYDLSSEQCMRHIPSLLKAPVSLQKHGIRLAFKKEKPENLPDTLNKMWSEAKNPTIRMELFKETFKLICSEKNTTTVDSLWTILKTFIDSLTAEENKQIYETLGKSAEVPERLRAEFTIKSYNFLKSLPAQANVENIINDVVYSTIDIMDVLDMDFMSGIILDDLEKNIIKKSFLKSEIAANYLLRVKNESSQLERYEKILVPILNAVLANWDHKEDDDNYTARQNLIILLDNICANYEKYVCALRTNHPIQLFNNILKKLGDSLPIVENYVVLCKFKIVLAFAKSVAMHKHILADIPKETAVGRSWWMDTKYHGLYFKASRDFAQQILTLLQADIATFFPSIYVLFKSSLDKALDVIRLNSIIKMTICKQLVEISTDFTPGLLVSIGMLPPQYCYQYDEDKEIINEIKELVIAHPSKEVRMHYYCHYM